MVMPNLVFHCRCGFTSPRHEDINQMGECKKCEAARQAKPPLGVKPRWLVAEERLGKLLEAMLRYHRAGRADVPLDWYAEASELANYLQTRKKKGIVR